MPLSSGQLLNNRYEIRAILGQGGMGAVYDGWDKNLGIRVAIKENLLFTEASQRQFEREAHMLASLRHSNLPGVIDHFHIVGQGQYLVMSFIEGEDLAQRLKRLGPLPEADVLRWADDVLNALAYLHKRGIIHRDIKPNNIKVTPEGEAVLVDFGIAKETFDETGAMTTTGARGLTPGFAPPEQYGGTRTDARSDIYAFGATLYVLLTGAAPPDAISRLAKPEKYVPLKRHSMRINNALAEAIDKALELDADDRWPSVEGMKAGLRAPKQVVPIKPPKSRDEVATAPPGEAPTLIPSPKPSRQFPKLNVPTRIFGLVGIAALAIMAVYVARGGGVAAVATNTVEPTRTERVATATTKVTNTVAPTKTPITPTVTNSVLPVTDTLTPTFTVTLSQTPLPATKTSTPRPSLTATPKATLLTPTNSVTTSESIPEAGTISDLQVIALGDTWIRVKFNYQFSDSNEASPFYYIEATSSTTEQLVWHLTELRDPEKLDDSIENTTDMSSALKAGGYGLCRDKN